MTLADPRQARAVGMRVAGATWADIAKAVRADTKTIWQWRKEPQFQAAMEEASAEVFDDLREEAKKIWRKCLETAERCLDSDDDRTAGQTATKLLSSPIFGAFAGGARLGTTPVQHEHQHAVTAPEVRITLVAPARPPELGPADDTVIEAKALPPAPDDGPPAGR